VTLQLIDQAQPKDYDKSAPFPFTYRCDKCGEDFKALTRARAEQHRCGKPLPKGEGETDLREEMAAMRAQNAALAAIVAKLQAGPAAPDAPVPVAVVENGDAPKKRGRPRKAKEPTPA
jgi:hypothetical protein